MKIITNLFKIITIGLLIYSIFLGIVKPFVLLWCLAWAIINFEIGTRVKKENPKWSFIYGWVWNFWAVIYTIIK